MIVAPNTAGVITRTLNEGIKKSRHHAGPKIINKTIKG